MINYKSNQVIKKRDAFKIATAPNWEQLQIMQHERVELNQYAYDESAGEGIHVCVLDTGVNVTHADFKDRAIVYANFVITENEHDFGGHGNISIFNRKQCVNMERSTGTHDASKIAGKLYGVAKKIQIHSVKILDKTGDSTASSLVKGIFSAIQAARPGKSVINMSLSGPRPRLIDDTISKAAIEHNIPVFVSAGNTATDACCFFSASNNNVFAVGGF